MTSPLVSALLDLVAASDRALNEGRHADAVASLEQARRLAPGLRALETRLTTVLVRVGRNDEAIALQAGRLRQDPRDLTALLGLAFSHLPIMAESADHARTARARYAHHLGVFARMVAASPPGERAKLAAGTSLSDLRPFYLPYLGENDRELQTIYGDAVAAAVAAAFPDHVRPLAIPPREPDGRWRIGFAGAFIAGHAVMKTHGAWVLDLDRSRFSLFAYNLDPDPRGTSPLSVIEGYRAGLVGPAAWAERIRADRPHALLYLDVGMHGSDIELAAMRLAPFQAQGLGHPTSSGLATIDVAYSSALMEPPEGDAHYRERLVRLPNLAMTYAPLAPRPPLDRAELGFDQTHVVFASVQSLFKLPPQDDWLFARIAAHLPAARFVFVREPVEALTSVFVRRLERVFRAEGLTMERHVRFVDRMPRERFLSLMSMCDLFLDGTAWSGHNTTMEAIATGLVPITWPGAMLRGRHTLGILRHLGLPELVAADADGLVALAVRLGGDAALRATVHARLRERSGLAFADSAPVQALADHLDETLTALSGTARA